jgi:hypothetical protein
VESGAISASLNAALCRNLRRLVAVKGQEKGNGPGNAGCSCRQPVGPGITSEIPEGSARQDGVRKKL